MTNKQIAGAFDELANLMELHEEDDFRIRSYRNAYLNLRKIDRPLADMTDAEIKSIKGVGPAIAGKIRELADSGKMATLEKYRAQTPPGVVDMLEVNGFGPKKVRIVWKEMGVESVGELWYACNENRLVEYKGFGLKTQEDLKNKLEYYLKSRDKLHLDAAEEEADFVCTWLSGRLPGAKIAVVGELRRRCAVISALEILVAHDGDMAPAFDGQTLNLEEQKNDVYLARLENNTQIRLYHCEPAAFGSKLFKYTGSTGFIDAFVKARPGLDFKDLDSEEAVFSKAGVPFIEPELRESGIDIASPPVNLIVDSDIRGVLHVHTDWSDGLHSLRDMCAHAQSLGYQYIGITDHSQSAFYANGLKPDRVLAQMEAIDELNVEMAPFRIFKGIESDILNDGALDYDDALLEKFDFIIASVHSNLRMNLEKATERVLKAVSHPRTTILGHPTGRLLLSREGYPLDWEQVFEACVKHKVAIELNANPYRLDIDWTLIPEAVRRGIPISINPDAHSKDGIHDIRYGVMVARKGGLTATSCLNAGSAEEFLKFR
ncbi:MAG: PHP domain-containing protein [Lewinellaceae bacterium]|nr:PHP domain-containing protein [Lewinellaceae bacterium]MCB9354591.1 PHP domain-containing protein [Lewinellaceae bacterium]